MCCACSAPTPKARAPACRPPALSANWTTRCMGSHAGRRSCAQFRQSGLYAKYRCRAPRRPARPAESSRGTITINPNLPSSSTIDAWQSAGAEDRATRAVGTHRVVYLEIISPSSRPHGQGHHPAALVFRCARTHAMFYPQQAAELVWGGAHPQPHQRKCFASSAGTSVSIAFAGLPSRTRAREASKNLRNEACFG